MNAKVLGTSLRAIDVLVNVGPPGPQGPPGPTAVSADPGNAASLGADGLIFAPQGLSAGEADGRYLQLRGGTVTGGTVFSDTAPCEFRAIMIATGAATFNAGASSLTPAEGDSSGRLATTEYVMRAVRPLIDHIAALEARLAELERWRVG
jgi:hypothetical protein